MSAVAGSTFKPGSKKPERAQGLAFCFRLSDSSLVLKTAFLKKLQAGY
jgi:hypothetical protein